MLFFSSTKRGRSPQAGITTLLVIGFMGVFMVILGTVTSYALEQARYGRGLFAREQALHIADAGLEYYRWFLAHNPSILVAGSGLVSPYTYSINDPEAANVGNAVITASPSMQCGALQWLDVTSVGRSIAGVGFPRTLNARYMKRSIAEYAFLYNSGVWFGSTNVGSGPYFSNNGIRMDGTTNSTVSAAVSQMYCDSSFGCSPASWQNGVFGNGSNSTLWKYPASTVDFSGMALNFTTLKAYAQATGVMLNPTSVTVAGITQGSTFSSVGASDNKGFHLVFKSDGTIDVYRVTATNGDTVYSYNDVVGDFYYSYPIIASQTFVANVTPPSGCALIYSQAKTWIEGTVSGKMTLIVADTGAYVPSIIFNNNLTYATTDGTTGLTAVAEGSLLLGLEVPNNMTLRGIFVAQTGLYGRDYYIASSGYLPAADYQYVTRTSLTVAGTIVSNQRGAVCWSSGSSCASGFLARNNSYDRVLAFAPPPFTPAATTDFSYVLWREQ
ncbi:MAG: hypothetical protein JWM46_603 [Candidatus Kaiserbacteria bacterium]|nr:hypothetical protein [Candidatus Kaiserbacteria bacterium]